MSFQPSSTVKLLGIGAAAFFAAGVLGLAAPAEAGPKKKFGVNIVLGGPGAYYSDGYYNHYGAYDPCRWLRRKARWTGSPYWIRRYRSCLRRNYW